jgi:hypothetical protein
VVLYFTFLLLLLLCFFTVCERCYETVAFIVLGTGTRVVKPEFGNREKSKLYMLNKKETMYVV